jgi:hypothetical protein
MNIFFLDYNTQECAKYHCDKHVVKMILETAQLLCTAHHVLDNSNNDKLYKKTHVNHPCAKWVRETSDNYLWALYLLKDLCEEYTYRYNKTHKTSNLISELSMLPKNIKRDKLTMPAQAMPEQYKDESSSILAYRSYYANEKKHLLKYTNRKEPHWLRGYKNEH